MFVGTELGTVGPRRSDLTAVRGVGVGSSSMKLCNGLWLDVAGLAKLALQYVGITAAVAANKSIGMIGCTRYKGSASQGVSATSARDSTIGV